MIPLAIERCSGSLGLRFNLDGCCVGVRRPVKTGLCSRKEGLPWVPSLVTRELFSSNEVALTVSKGGPKPRSCLVGVLLLGAPGVGKIPLVLGGGACC